MTAPPPPRPRNLLQRVLIVAAVGMGVGFGTCGLVVGTEAGNGRVWGKIAGAGAVVFFISFAVAAVTFILFAALQLRDHFRNRRNQ